MTTESNRRHPDDHQPTTAANVQYIRSVSQLLDSEGKLIRRGSSLPKFAGNSRTLDENYDPRDAFTQSEEILARLRDPENDWENFDFLPDDVFTHAIPELPKESFDDSARAHINQSPNHELLGNDPVRYELVNFDDEDIICPDCGMAGRWTTTERYELGNTSPDERGALTLEPPQNEKPKAITKFIHVHADDPVLTAPVKTLLCDVDALDVKFAIVTQVGYGARDINGETAELGRGYILSIPPGEDSRTRNRILKIIPLHS